MTRDTRTARPRAALRAALAAAAASTLLLSGCAVSASGTAPAADGAATLTFASTGSEFQDKQAAAWQVPFTEETGIAFENDSPPDPAKIKAQVDAGQVTWDLVDMELPLNIEMCGTYVEELDYSVIDRTVFPEGTTGDCGFPVFSYPQLFLYDHETFAQDAPTSAADFFDTAAYPGKRIVTPLPTTGLLEFALIADGVPRDQLYPLDVERALAKFDTIRDSLVFADTYAQIQQSLESKQVAMALALGARSILAIDNGAPFSVVWDTTVITSDAIGIVKGSKKKDEAMQFLASLTQTEQQQAFASASGMLVGRPDAAVTYTGTAEELNALSPEHIDTVLYADPTWWGENSTAVTERWTAWKLG